ncbi:MAG: lamin tail domain-containing protein, partial [Akkermansiaceae bacterium]|nr:lamin tail domain-containing protein [Verrucomicrobiales bacterium]
MATWLGLAFLLWAGILIEARSAAAATPETPGPCSRKTPFVLSEIMYHPAAIQVVTNGVTNKLSTEFLELYNSNPFYEDLSGFRISGDIDFTFPKGAGLPGLSRLVLAKNTNDFQAYYQLTGVTVLSYGLTNNVTNLVNSLSREGTLRLRNDSGGIVLEINYDNDNPWPAGADGTGHSLVLARPSLGENDPQAWALSDQVGGSPGQPETYANDPLRDVVINEFLAHTDPPLLDTIELYNHSNQPNNLSGCILTDDAGTNKFVIPPGTIIPARGFVKFDQNQMGFALNTLGETIYFWNSNRTRLLDAVQYGDQENGVSTGRSPDGAPEFYRLQTRTLGTNNSGILVGEVVINEVMFDPISGDNDDEFVELFNRTAAPVNLGGWRLEGGVSFTIPSNTVLAAKSYLVLAENQTNLLAKHPQLNATNLLGNYSGSLANSGERIALSLPDTTIVTNSQGKVSTNLMHIVVDEVTYRAGGQWPAWTRCDGSSLERRDVRANPRLAANWADSDESAKAPWTTVDFPGVLDNGSGSANALEGGLQGEGECLLDDVEVIYNGNNLVTNSTFASGLGNWIVRGNHIRSSLDPTNGFGGGPCLRLRASSRADYGPNRFYVPLSSAPPNGATVTIRAKVRWLCGWPEILLRLHGNYLEAPARLALPANPGTPGLANSRATTNAAPAIYEVTHSPVLPVDGEAVVVTAQVHDPDGVATLQLKYRVDPDTTYATLNMTDGGAGGDAIPGDGIFSATIPGQPAGTLVAFVLSAADASPAPAASLFPTNTPGNSALPRECLVRFGDPLRASSFGTYRQWFTAAAINAWTNSPILGNEPVEGTFVYGDFRAIYNFNSHYAGSPSHQTWISPLVNCHYSMGMPRDNVLLGTDNFNKLHGPGNNPFQDASLQREQTGIWVSRQLGLPWANRRFVNLYINGVLRATNSLIEDIQVPGDDFLEEYFPGDSEGSLHKINGWWEMNDAPSGAMPGTSRPAWATLGQFYSPAGSGVYKPARYRWTWQPRGYSSTGNDFTNLFRLLDAVNTPASQALTANVEAEVDMESWMRTWAVRKSLGDWDFYGGTGNGQNGYIYRTAADGWKMFLWDMNIIIGNNDSLAPGTGLLPTTNYGWADSVTLNKLYGHPPFRRMYLRALKEIANGPLQAANVDAVLDAKYNAFTADGLSVMSPDATFSYTDPRSKDYATNVPFSGSIKFWLADAREKILARVAQEDAADFSVNGSASFSTNNNLITFSGSAPVEIKTITINTNAYPVTWLTNAGWTMSVPLGVGTNALVFQAWDVHGKLLTNFNQTITVNYTGTVATPEGSIGFNEILHHPARPGAEFVELFNRATNAFDLTGWRVNGLDYTFPSGAFIGPQSYLVLAGDWNAFGNTHGITNPPFDFFEGTLSPDGETLTLFRPGPLPGQEMVVDRVRYEAAAPWPTATNGASLQLVDSAQDNSRVANWSAVTTNNGAAIPSWVRVSATGIPRPTSALRPLYVYLQLAGDIYIDDISVVAGSVAESGASVVTNGGFEASLAPWTIGSAGNHSA